MRLILPKEHLALKMSRSQVTFNFKIINVPRSTKLYVSKLIKKNSNNKQTSSKVPQNNNTKD